MAEQATKETRVVDIIRGYFTKEGKCTVDISKYQAALHIIKCDGSEKCWTTIACQQEIAIPEMDREMIEVNNNGACDIFAGDAETWKEYVPDTTRSMSEYSQDVYYSEALLDTLIDASGAKSAYIVLVDIADSRRTQFAFRAHLKTLSASFVANQDSDVSMIQLTWQPTGQPFITKGVDIVTCAN